MEDSTALVLIAAMAWIVLTLLIGRATNWGRNDVADSHADASHAPVGTHYVDVGTHHAGTADEYEWTHTANQALMREAECARAQAVYACLALVARCVGRWLLWQLAALIRLAAARRRTPLRPPNGPHAPLVNH